MKSRYAFAIPLLFTLLIGCGESRTTSKQDYPKKLDPNNETPVVGKSVRKFDPPNPGPK